MSWWWSGGDGEEEAVFGWVVEEEAGGELVEGLAGGEQALGELGEGLGIGQEDAEVAQANGVGGGLGCADTLPGVEADVMVVTAGADKGHAEARRGAHDIEAEQAVVKIEGFLDITDVQVDVTKAGAGGDGQIEAVCGGQEGKESFEVEGFTAVAGDAIGTMGRKGAVFENKGAIFGRFGVELDAVALGIIQVGGFGVDVIGGMVGDFEDEEAGDGPGQVTAGGEDDGEVVKAGGALVAFEPGLLLQLEQVVFGRAKTCAISVTPTEMKAKGALVEGELIIEVGNKQGDQPEAGGGVNGMGIRAGCRERVGHEGFLRWYFWGVKRAMAIIYFFGSKLSNNNSWSGINKGLDFWQG